MDAQTMMSVWPDVFAVRRGRCRKIAIQTSHRESVMAVASACEDAANEKRKSSWLFGHDGLGRNNRPCR